MSIDFEERLAQLDALIVKTKEETEEKLASLRDERQRLREQKFIGSYRKWKIEEGNHYLLFLDDTCPGLLSGFYIVKDDTQAIEVELVTWTYYYYNDETGYALEMDLRHYSSEDFDYMLRKGNLYLVSKDIYDNVVTQLMELPDYAEIDFIEKFVMATSQKLN